MIQPRFAAALLLCAAASPVAAQDAGAAVGADEVAPPLSVELAYHTDLFSAWSGAGPATGGAGLLDLALRAELVDVLPWPGVAALLHVHATHGAAPSSLVGDAQGVSNIEAPDGWRVYEAWLQQDVGGVASILAGLYEVNSEFDVVPSAALFLNSSFGIGPDFSGSGVHGPSTYPYTALGLRARTVSSDGRYAQAAVLDGVPGRPDDPERARLLPGRGDGALLAFELGVEEGARLMQGATGPAVPPRERALGRGEAIETHRYKAALGGWMYTAPRPRLDRPTERSRSWGAYVLGERRLRGGPGGPRVSAFARLGVARGGTSRFGAFGGLGVVAVGFLRAEEDVTGLAVAHARDADAFRAAWRAEREVAHAGGETVLEASHRLVLGDRVTVQPDLQIVFDPGADASRPVAWVFTLRGAVSFALP